MKIEKEEKEIMLYNDSIKENITSWIEQDIILPDTKPDAIKIVNVTVNPYVTNIEPGNDSLKVNGRLNYFIIYKANETDMGIRGVLTQVPFTQNLTIKNINPNMNIMVYPKVKNVIFALPNERKISVKTEIIFRVEANSVTKVPFIQKFKNDQNIQMKMFEDSFNNIIESKCETITSREDVMLSSENSDFGEILKVTTEITNTEYKQSYNKLLVKGDIQAKILYLPEDNFENIKRADISIPFTGMIEFNNIRDVSLFDVRYTLKDFNVKPNLDITSNKTLNVDYQVAVCASMYEKENISYVEDFYSENKNLKYDTKTQRVVKSTETIVKDIEIRDTIEKALSKEYNLLDYDIDTSYLIVKNVDNGINVDGNLKLTILSQNSKNMDIESRTLDIPVNEKLDLPEINNNSRINVSIKVENVSLEGQGTNINARILLKVNIEMDKIIDVAYIEDIEQEEFDDLNLDSMIIYVVKPKDTLWSIAKKYKTTVEKIAAINNIENPDFINEGQKLLIIR